MSQPTQYQPKPGEEQYVALWVTKKQGQPVEPRVELYHPHQVAAVLGLTGFSGDIVYDPRTAAQKQHDAPANDTVKSAEPLTDADSYRARYKQLFHEDAPFNLAAAEVKHIVGRAEAQLAHLAKGIDPVAPEEVAQPATISSPEPAFKAPADKDGWLALYRSEFPEDTTEDKELTVKVMREKLGK